MRRLERAYLSGPVTAPLPRIGDADNRRDDFVLLGQNPFFSFPASNVSERQRDERRACAACWCGFSAFWVRKAPLPLATNEEAHHWALRGDDAFPRFLDLINHRFLQLFFRAWADARPAAQHDRPAQDRFLTYLGSAIGIGSEPFRDRDGISDWRKLGFAGLLGDKAKSASRLRGAIRGLLEIAAEIEPFVGSHLALEPGRFQPARRTNVLPRRQLHDRRELFQRPGQVSHPLYAEDIEQYLRFLPDRRNVRGFGRSRVPLCRRRTRLGRRACASCVEGARDLSGRASAKGESAAGLVGLDDLARSGFLRRRLSLRRHIPCRRPNSAQTRAD